MHRSLLAARSGRPSAKLRSVVACHPCNSPCPRACCYTRGRMGFERAVHPACLANARCSHVAVTAGGRQTRHRHSFRASRSMLGRWGALARVQQTKKQRGSAEGRKWAGLGWGQQGRWAESKARCNTGARGAEAGAAQQAAVPTRAAQPPARNGKNENASCSFFCVVG